MMSTERLIRYIILQLKKQGSDSTLIDISGKVLVDFGRTRSEMFTPITDGANT